MWRTQAFLNLPPSLSPSAAFAMGSAGSTQRDKEGKQTKTMLHAIWSSRDMGNPDTRCHYKQNSLDSEEFSSLMF